MRRVNIFRYFFPVFSLLTCSHLSSFGMATEQFGPDHKQDHPTIAQPGWPVGMLELIQHDSRIYSRWVNGHEQFKFQTKAKELNELITLFSKLHIRDHAIVLKPGKAQEKTFDGLAFDYHVDFTFLGGIALHAQHRKGKAETHDPTLTITLDPERDAKLLKNLAFPDHVILHNEIADSSFQTKATEPERKVWHAHVHFTDGSPAVDFESGVSTKVTLWKKTSAHPLALGEIAYDGRFHVAFSEAEITQLKTGHSWLTLTVGNWNTKASKTHSKLTLDHLFLDPEQVKILNIPKLRYYYGRLLFEDGSPPILDPLPWPGAEINVSFPHAGQVTPDAEGYFQLYFTPEQLASLKAKKARKNIYIPQYERKGSSRALYAYPVDKLSLDKDKAGVIKILKPRPKDQK